MAIAVKSHISKDLLIQIYIKYLYSSILNIYIIKKSHPPNNCKCQIPLQKTKNKTKSITAQSWEMRKSLLVSDGEGAARAALQTSCRESHWLQRSGMATKDRRTNYNNGEGHETSMSDSSVLQYMLFISCFILKKKGKQRKETVSYFREKETETQINTLSDSHKKTVTTKDGLLKTKKDILYSKDILKVFWGC